MQLNYTGKQSKIVKTIQQQKDTAQQCIDACVEEKEKSGGKKTNFVMYTQATKECRCSSGELTLENENGTQACFLVPKLPGINGEKINLLY